MTRARRARQDLQDYRNRDYVLHILDDRHFDALNSMPNHYTTAVATTGCLDALEMLPGGCMRSITTMMFDQYTVTRGIDLKDQRRIDKLMEEIFSGDLK